MHRNMAQSLIEHGSVTTTLAKAKDIRPYVEKLITLAVKVRRHRSSDPAASLRARRRIHSLLGDRSLIPAAHMEDYETMSDASRAKTMRMPSGRRYRTGQPKGRLAFTAESVMHRLIEKLASRFEERPGGYTRLIKLAKVRKGDNAPTAMIQLIGDEEAPSSLPKPARSARQRRADARYAAAIKASKTFAKPADDPEPAPQEEAQPEDAVEESAEPEASADGGDEADKPEA